MTERELLAGTRNAEVYVYKESEDQWEDQFTLSISMPWSTVEYSIDRETAQEMADDMVDGETIRKREKQGDW